MISNNLSSFINKVIKPNHLLRNVRSFVSSPCCHKSQVSEEENSDTPVQFSTSKAARWSVKNTYGEPFERKIQPPASQPTVVCLSLIILMVYFTILREENDIDELLYKPLSDHGVQFQTDTK